MALPLSRNRTYVNGVTPVDANDLNDIQDCIIAGKHGERTLVISAAGFVKLGGNSATSPATAGDTWQFGTPPNDAIVGAVSLPVFSRIKSVTFRINKGGSASAMFLALNKRAADVNSSIVSANNVTSGAAWITHTFAGLSHVVAFDEPIWLHVQAGAIAHMFSYASIVYNTP